MLELRQRYEAARQFIGEWRQEARECFDMYSGKQWSEQDKQKLIEQQRVPVTFNRVAILIDAVIGYEVNNRQETRYIPRTPGDAKVNELLSEAARYFRDQCDAEFEESDAFRDDIICGMGWTNDRITDERNPDYDLVRDRVDPLRMLWDPSSRKPNLEDARYLIYETSMSKDEARALVPEWDGEYIHADWLGDQSDDNINHSNPRDAYKGLNTENSATRDIRVLEYQYVVDRQEHVITNPETGEAITMADDEWTGLKEEDAKALGQNKVTRRVREWKRAFAIGGEIFEKKHPYPKGPTYHCVTGKRDRNTGYWFGLVRALRDPQMWSNKWLSQIMHLINTSAKPGYDIEKGAIDNVGTFESKAARPGAINVFTDGALQQGRVQRREAVGLPPDLSNLMQYANESMQNVSGVNAELLGMADREQAGVLEYQRKQSAVTLLAPLFDSFRRYRKISGRCWLYFMQHYLTDGRLIRITKDDGGQMNVPFQKGPVPNPAFQQQQGMMGHNGGPPMPPMMQPVMDNGAMPPGMPPQGGAPPQISGQQIPGAPGGQPEPPSTQPLQAQPGAAAPAPIPQQPIKYVIGEDMTEPLAYNRSRKVKCEKVMWAKITGSEILEGPQEWAGKYIPIVPCLGEEVWIEGKRVLRSAIRFAKDPSRLYNWARSNAVETLALAPKQPFIMTKDEIDGYEKQWNEASTRPMPYLLYNERGAGRPQRQQMSVTDTGALEEARQSSDDIKATTGLFDASLGAQGNETSGKAIVARQRQSNTATFVFSDNQVRAVKYTGRILVDLIPKIYDTERVVRLMGDDGKETWEKVNVVDRMTGKVVANDLSLGRYDVVIDAGPGYMTKRMEAAEGLVQLSQAAPQFAPILIPRIAKNLDWPEAQEIGDEIKQASQPQQAPPDPRIQADIQMKQMDLKAKEMDLAGQQMGLKSKEMDLQGKAMDIQGKQVERQHAAQESAQNNDQHIYQVASKAVIDALKQLGVSVQ
jgi:Skp family chaperone for outer membrane proteins